MDTTFFLEIFETFLFQKDSSSDVGSTEDMLQKSQMKADLWKFQDREKKLQEELGKLTDKVAQVSEIFEHLNLNLAASFS